MTDTQLEQKADAMQDTLSDRRIQANNAAVNAMLQADPVLIDVTPALDALPGMTRHTILTSGAPLPWPAYEGGQRRAILGAALFEGSRTRWKRPTLSCMRETSSSGRAMTTGA